MGNGGLLVHPRVSLSVSSISFRTVARAMLLSFVRSTIEAVKGIMLKAIAGEINPLCSRVCELLRKPASDQHVADLLQSIKAVGGPGCNLVSVVIEFALDFYFLGKLGSAVSAHRATCRWIALCEKCSTVICGRTRF